MTSPGPVELGRGVVVLAGHQPPETWASCPASCSATPRWRDPGPVAEDLHRYWIDRRPVVVELGVDPAALRAPERCHRPVYELTPDFAFGRERLQFLVWANNYDARGGDPIWWHGRKAARHFAGDGVGGGGAADIMLADGTPMFIDGGPAQPPPLPSRIGVVHRWNAEAGRLRPAGRSQPSSELAPDQLAAVCHRTGAARVIAPAGSGKTRVLTERLRHLVGDRGVHPGTVTALAYNTKAARGAEGAVRGHRGCGEAQHPHPEQLRLVDLQRVRVSRPTACSRGTWPSGTCCSGTSRSAGRPTPTPWPPTSPPSPQSGSGSTHPRWSKRPIRTPRVSPRDSSRYRAALAEAGAVDFDEQIYQAIAILLANPDARSVAQSTCRHLLGRRVPGPQPRPPAAHPAPGRARLRLLRGRRRRPGHLRLLRGEPGVPHQLLPLLPRRRRPRP